MNVDFLLRWRQSWILKSKTSLFVQIPFFLCVFGLWCVLGRMCACVAPLSLLVLFQPPSGLWLCSSAALLAAKETPGVYYDYTDSQRRTWCLRHSPFFVKCNGGDQSEGQGTSLVAFCSLSDTSLPGFHTSSNHFTGLVCFHILFSMYS